MNRLLCYGRVQFDNVKTSKLAGKFAIFYSPLKAERNGRVSEQSNNGNLFYEPV